MTMLALMSGFVMLSYVQTLSKDAIMSDTKLPLLAGMSGLFFASASLAKPTAFQDILLFALLMIGLWA